VLLERHLAERPTGEGEAATRALRASVDAVVVVGREGPGGFGSRPVRRIPAPRIHVEAASDLAAEWFFCCATALVLADPTVAPAAIDAVRRALESLPRA
jgi:hypothetical protein